MVIAVERCVCVLYPHRASTFLRTRTMGLILVFSLLLFQICCLIYPFNYCISAWIEKEHLKYLLLPSEFYFKNKMFSYTVEHTILGTVVPMVTFLILSVSTGITVASLRVALKWRQETTSLPSNSHTQQVALTSMLVILSLIHIFTALPLVTRQVFFWFSDIVLVDSRSRNIFMTVTPVIYVISEANSCIHFFVYYRLSAKFRMVLRRCFCDAYNEVEFSTTRITQTSQDLA